MAKSQLKKGVTSIMRKHFLFVKILTFIVLFCGTIAVFNTSNKILKTSWELFKISDNINYYNEQSYKTDNMTDAVMEQFNERSERFYHSNDSTVRWFSNLNTVLKFLVVIVMIFAQPAMIYMWFVISLKEALKLRKKIARVRNCNKKQNRRVA
mgnify:FL=1